MGPEEAAIAFSVTHVSTSLLAREARRRGRPSFERALNLAAVASFGAWRGAMMCWNKGPVSKMESLALTSCALGLWSALCGIVSNGFGMRDMGDSFRTITMLFVGVEAGLWFR